MSRSSRCDAAGDLCVKLPHFLTHSGVGADFFSRNIAIAKQLTAEAASMARISVTF
jgi:hypothetical protein